MQYIYILNKLKMNNESQQETREEAIINYKKSKSNKGPYVLGEKLGEGAFAKVRLATQIHIKEKCAVKILEKKLLESSRDIQRLKKEIKILKKLRHKNIIQLYDIMESKRNLYFVMEYCKGGELFDYIVKKKRLKEPEACSFFQQIINGVEYLHIQGIIHRDLKPENLLLDDNNHIKISDFGLSTFYSKNNYLQTACGTPSYAPPEMLEGQEYNGEATDVWSCGIILYAMLCGTLPFSESKEQIIVKKIKTHDYSIPNYLSNEAKDLLNHILIINPKERFTINQIKNHPWFNLVKPHLMKGINFEEDIIPVDDKILDMVKSHGFDPEECRTLLLKNKFCSLTTIYYLCLKKYVRENGKSISDLESDLFEEYINNPKNKIKKIEEEINLVDSSNHNKTERENTPHIRLSNKKLSTNKTNRNNFFNTKRNGTPTLNYIKVSNDRRNLKSTKNIKKEYILSENSNTTSINTNLNQKKIKIDKESFIENKNINNANNNKNVKGNKTIIQNNIKKNTSLGKNGGQNKLQAKKITINKNDVSKTPIIENETKNNSIQKKKIKIINNNNKDKKNLGTESKPKPVRHETEKKSVTTKFNLNEENSSKQKKDNSSINTNVNIINININNNNNTNNANNPSITDKELSYIIKQKLKEINQIKNNEKEERNQNQGQNQNQAKNQKQNQNQINQNKINGNKNIDSSFKALGEEEEELKALLNPLYLKDINLSSNNQSNTITNILNNTNNSNLFSSIFQDSFPNQANTFIGMPQNYSLKTDNNANSNNSRPKSSLFQYLGNDIEKFMLMQGEKPINVINYIAKKLVASSFCGSFNFQSGYNNSYANNANNNNINQTVSFLKNNSESNNSLSKSNGNGENKIENSFENNSISKDTSLFLNDELANDDKDLNFKNLVTLLNKKFKSYLSKEKLNKTEISNKNKVIKTTNKISHNNVIANLDHNKSISINSIKKDENKNNLYDSFSNNTNIPNSTNPRNNNSNSYILLSYSKNSKNKKITKINQTSLKYKNTIQVNNKEIKDNTINLPLNSSKKNSYNLNNYKSHYNTFLDISTNYDPGMDSRNSSVERSISIKKNELRNFSCSPSNDKKKENNVSKMQGDKKNVNCKNNRVMNLTKGNRNINIIPEDEEYKDNKKIVNSKSKKKKKYQVCQNKVTINLSIGDETNNNYKTISNKKTNSKIKKNVAKKK